MHGLHCGAASSKRIHHRTPSQPDRRRKARPQTNRKSWADQRLPHAPNLPANQYKINPIKPRTCLLNRWIQAKYNTA